MTGLVAPVAADDDPREMHTMSQPQDEPQAANGIEIAADGRNRPKPTDRAAALRQIHTRLVRAEENLYTVLESSHGSLASRDWFPRE